MFEVREDMVTSNRFGDFVYLTSNRFMSYVFFNFKQIDHDRVLLSFLFYFILFYFFIFYNLKIIALFKPKSLLSFIICSSHFPPSLTIKDEENYYLDLHCACIIHSDKIWEWLVTLNLTGLGLFWLDIWQQYYGLRTFSE